jgi:topoisomerase-4 subunit A
MKGHGIDADSIKFKEGDGPAWMEEVMTTDRLVIMSSDGRAFILAADKLPGGRGNGEPIRLSIELEDNVAIVAMFKFDPERKRVMASSSGYGFIVSEAELESNRKAGKQVVNTGEGHLVACAPVEGDMIAVVGTNRKMLIFPLKDLPEMSRGKGNKLQSYSGKSELADLMTFDKRDGLIVMTGGRHRAFDDWKSWRGARAQAGKVVPKGFPRSGTFSG